MSCISFGRFSLLFFLLPTFLFGQEGSFEFHWMAVQKHPNAANKIPYFSSAQVQQGGRVVFNISTLGCSSLLLENAVYSNLTKEEKIALQGKTFSSKIEMTRKVAGMSNQQMGYEFDVVPFRWSDSLHDIQKLLSIEWKCASYAVPEEISNPLSPNIPSRFNLRTANTSSVLATGKWYKIRIQNSGVYKLDKTFFDNLGIDTKNINPQTIQIFGQGGGQLPQPNSAPRATDLQEVAISVIGEADLKFDAQDYVLFFGQSHQKWIWNNERRFLRPTWHDYDDNVYYFLRIGERQGARINSVSSSGTADTVLNSYVQGQIHEVNKINYLRSGRSWVGEGFDAGVNQIGINFDISNVVPNTEATFLSRVTARGTSASSNIEARFYVGSSLLGRVNLPTSNTVGDYRPTVVHDSGFFRVNSTQLLSANGRFVAELNKTNDPASIGNLDFMILNLQKSLSNFSKVILLHHIPLTSKTNTQYQLTGDLNNIQVWKISTHQQVERLLFDANDKRISIDGTQSQTLFIFDPNLHVQSPLSAEAIPNQDLRGLNTPKFLIVCPPAVLDAANQLAQYRTSKGMPTIAITDQQIYNEFSSGTRDLVAIRDFARHLYMTQQGGDTLKYLLMFGAASYDPKNITGQNSDTYLPIYESFESYNPVATYSSDDFFGFMDASEGEWSESPALNYFVDIGVGRIPIRSVPDAYGMVQKIIRYESPGATFGNWRNKIAILADDKLEDGNTHIEDADQLATIIIGPKAPEINILKMYTASYPYVNSASGLIAPLATAEVNAAVNDGLLFLNYTGHGNEVQLGSLNLINVATMASWSNGDRCPFMVAATCDFGRYDDPSKASGGELVVTYPDHGAIGMLASTRPVYSSSNAVLNRAFYGAALNKRNGYIRPTLGDIIKATKNGSLSGVGNRNYALLGDPSMVLNYPKETVVALKVKTSESTDSTSSLDSLKALSRVRIQGEVLNRATGLLFTAFQGNVQYTVFDKPSIITVYEGQSNSYTFQQNKNIIQEGLAAVEGGKFSVDFIIPKDINYTLGNGKLTMYASSTSLARDAIGYRTDLVVGGSSNSTFNDVTPPHLRVFMNDTSFISGGIVSNRPVFVARLADESGINIIGSGIGHDLTLYLNEGQQQKIILNRYYKSDKNSYQSGTVQYPMQDLSPGKYTLKFKAWDNYNNSSETYLDFVVASSEALAIKNVLNYPNPFTTHTAFHVDHNRSSEDLEMMVQVYTVSGILVKTLTTTVYGSSSHLAELKWDGMDDYGDVLGRGVYVYKFSLKSLRDDSKTFEYNKLVLLK